jgi:hypothetical protein
MMSVSSSCLRGRLVIVGKEPDGDSVRFVPDSSGLLGRLANADRIRPSRDGSAVAVRCGRRPGAALRRGDAAAGRRGAGRLAGHFGATGQDDGTVASTNNSTAHAVAPAGSGVFGLTVAPGGYGDVRRE